MRILLFNVFLLLTSLSYAQQDNEEQFRKDSLAIIKVKLVRPQFKFDNRLIFYNGQALGINGIDAGVMLKDKLRVTVGYYGMSGDLKSEKFTSNNEDFGKLIRLDYGSLNTELIYKDARFFSLGMPLEIGAGQLILRNKNFTTDRVYATEKGALMFANFGLSGTFKPMRFLGLKAMVGYRKVIFNQVKNFDFNGFFTSIGLNIDVHEIIVDVKMFRLKKKYKRGNNIGNAVDIITE